MAIEKMTSEEIQTWLRYKVGARSATWFADTTDPDTWIEQARLGIPHSDVNLARELYACFDGMVHYVPGTGSWHVWNGVYHERIEGDLLADWMFKAFLDAHKDALALVKGYYETLAGSLSGDAKAKKMAEYSKFKFGDHRAYRDRIHNNSGMAGAKSAIKNEFSVVDNFFVDDRRWLVFLNGVLDLEEFREARIAPGDLGRVAALLQDHDPSRPVYRCVDAEFNPAAGAESWSHFLNTSLPDPELRKFLATVTGAAFMGQSKLKTIPVLKGKKDSGKTIYIDTIHRLSGGYGGQPDTAAINKIAGGQNFEQDAFRGLRFAAVSEPDSDRKVDDSFLKKYTGGDVLSTRNLHARSVEWKSQGVLFFATNRDLKFNTSDKAILERFATVEFPHQFFDRTDLPPFLGEEFLKDRGLEERLIAELSGILNWVINGALVYLAEGGVYSPESVRQYRVKQYEEGSTAVQWVQNVQANNNPHVGWDTSADGKECLSVGDAYSDYVQWCAEDNEEALGRKRFSADIQDHLGVALYKYQRYHIPNLVSKVATY